MKIAMRTIDHTTDRGIVRGVRVTALEVFPVKSLAGVRVERATVEPWGLAGDRRWALIDPEGEPVTAREVNALLGIRAEPVADGLRLVDRAGSSLGVAAPRDADAVPVGLSRQGEALPAADAASAWLTERAGRDLRLVWQPDPTRRSINPERGGRSGESLSLADAGPLLLCSEASLAQLNEWMVADHLESGGGAPDPLVVARFRPNVVIDGGEPFVEETWPRVRIGAVWFRTTMVCDRCVMTTIDPVDLRRGKEPIRTLARHHRWDGATWFGTRLVLEGAGTGAVEIGVGDPVAPG